MRLTKKKIICSQNIAYEIIPSFECDRGICVTTELLAINKLGQLEDIMEKYNFETVEDLDGFIQSCINRIDYENKKEKLL